MEILNEIEGYYLYDRTSVDGKVRYTYYKMNPPPYGPGKPSFDTGDSIIVWREE